MADSTASEKLDLEERRVSSGVADVSGGIGDTSLLVPTMQVATEDDDSVFYSEKDFVPIRACHGPALTSADLTGVGGDPNHLRFTITSEPWESRAEPAVRLPAVGTSTPPAPSVPEDQRDLMLEKNMIHPMDFEDLIPVDPRTKGSEKILTNSPAEVPRRLKTQKEVEVQTLEDFDPWRETALSLGLKLEGFAPQSAPTPSPEKESNQENGEERIPLRRLTEKEILNQEQDVKEGGEQGEVSERYHSSSELGEETPSAGDRKKSTDPDFMSKYNTVSYRKIRKGNTRQKINEFESMMN
ncbi:ermin-like [Brienomyrus brachyistius]|uniref:ermin-like n=1 Tax=Brienomyrus brachyistius TaxID=42636 RepID=UPI0020B3772B|nr:ermin-like [Brienomyrus brachyistius]